MSWPTARNLQFGARQSYRPTAFWSRSTVQVEAALAISRVLLVGYFALHIAHRAAALHDPSPAASRASHTGRKKLIFSSTVVKDSSGARVLANAIPIAASAMSHRIPPCSVPMGFACRGSAEKVAVARPLAISFASKPIRRATATSFDFARSLRSGWMESLGQRS